MAGFIFTFVGFMLKNHSSIIYFLMCLFRIHYNQPDLKNTYKLVYKKKAFIM